MSITETTTHSRLSTVLRTKIGKLYNGNKKSTSSQRSQSSPVLIIPLVEDTQPQLPVIKKQRYSFDNTKPKSFVEKNIPSCQNIIDLSELKGQELISSVQHLVSILFSDWISIHELEDISIKRISGAMTNAVFFVTIGSNALLLRVYGAGCDQILDRNKELDWLSRLSQLHIGPRLLGIFGNGRFEEYLQSTTLTRNDIREADISAEIASRMHQLHSIVDVFPPAHDETLEVWSNIKKWHSSLVKDLVPILVAKNPNWKSRIESELDIKCLNTEIEACKAILSRSKSHCVFAHNDTQYGNILKIKGTNELVVIDFEYAGYNPRAFDIANHFCEWMYDYHAVEPSTMHLDQYPTKDQQKLFLSSYSKQQNVDDLLVEVDQWKMACHLSWALWGLVQASQSEIDFDYFSYSMQRIQAFRHDLKKASTNSLSL